MHYWLILGSAIGFGLAPMLVQILLSAQFRPEVIALYRFAVPLLLVLPNLRGMMAQPGEWLRTGLVGAFAAIGMVSYFALFQIMPPSTLILIYYTYPMFAILIGCLFFGTPPTRNRFITAALILLAVVMTLDGASLTGVTPWTLAASFLAPVGFAILLNYFSSPVKSLPTRQRMAASLLGHMVVLIPLVIWLQPAKLLPQIATEWLWLGALGFFSAAIPQFLFARGCLRAGMESTTLIGSTEIVFAMLFGTLLFGTTLTHTEILAAILIVLSSLVRLEQTPQNAKETSKPKTTSVDPT